MHNSFTKGKVISECKNDKPWKNEIGKVSAPFLRRPVPEPYFHPPFLIFQIPSPLWWRLSKFTSPFKKGERVWTMRLISPLSNISKIFEKSMHIHLVNFLRKNKLLFCYQFGLQNGYSVNHALTSLTELERKALDEWICMWSVHWSTESLWHCRSQHFTFKALPLLWCKRNSSSVV